MDPEQLQTPRSVAMRAPVLLSPAGAARQALDCLRRRPADALLPGGCLRACALRCALQLALSQLPAPLTCCSPTQSWQALSQPDASAPHLLCHSSCWLTHPLGYAQKLAVGHPFLSVDLGKVPALHGVLAASSAHPLPAGAPTACAAWPPLAVHLVPVLPGRLSLLT